MTRTPARLLALLLTVGLSACNDKVQPSEDSGDVQDDTSDTNGQDSGDSGHTGDSADTGGSDTDAWTTGPALPDCAAQSGAGDLVALSGVVLAPGGAVAGVVVYSRSSGEITCVGEECDTSAADVVCTEGVISPGLIDAHDHLQYNALAPWQHEGLYSDRYEWRSDDAYWDYRAAYDGIESDLKCEIMKWAELRELVSGVTAAVGSSDDGDCIDVAVRNLDEDEDFSGIEDYALYYSASTVTDKYEDGDGDYYAGKLADGSYGAIENHVAEGVDGEARGEIDHMFSVGMEGPGQIYVHASDATTSQLARMAEKGTAIAWSPRSNLDLYANTTPADVALRLGVPVVLGPDWTWSGSANMPEELACAQEFLSARGNWGEHGVNDVTLWAMATERSARALGLEGTLGSLVAGARADISVYPYSDEPYRAVIQAGSQDVSLVVLQGQALYGLPEHVSALAANPEWCESTLVCGDSSQERLVCLRTAESGVDAQTMAEVESALIAGLAETDMPEDLAYAAELFGLWTCEQTRPTCDPGAPSAGDEDGDGVADSADVCVGAWDPYQDDQDKDGVGDVCDPCPLVPGATDCRMDAEDIDDDGFRTEDDLCPYLYDPEQLDSDSDGQGDACDRCPDYANPGDGTCPTTLDVLSNEAHPDHPGQLTEWLVTDLIVTAVRDTYGYYAQDPTLSDFGGVFVYDRGAATVEVGDRVDVTGTYMEYNGLFELSDASTEVTGTGEVPAPISISDACDVGTDGADAERYEAMLVTVTGLSVTNENPDSPSDYNELEVNGCLRVDDLIWPSGATWLERAVGTSYDAITGVLTYSYDNFKVLPRGSDDVSGG